jgi:hypothetical protein
MTLEGGAERFDEPFLLETGTNDAVGDKDARDQEVVNVPDRTTHGYHGHREIHGMTTHPVESMSGE